jgi:hypothetical protein
LVLDWEPRITKSSFLPTMAWLEQQRVMGSGNGFKGGPLAFPCEESQLWRLR